LAGFFLICPDSAQSQKRKRKNMKREKPSVHQTMTNSPGGIQAGRDVTINLKPAERQLTIEQMNILTDELRADGFRSVAVMELGDREANNFAQQFLVAIRASGWQVTRNYSGMVMPPPYGLILTVPRREAPEGIALLSALVKVGLHVEVRVRPNVNQSELLIGLRPD
jgi:hypothetical protein